MANKRASADHLLSTNEVWRLAQIARSKLTHEECNALIQADRNNVTPAVYALGLKDGAELALERQSRERKLRAEREAEKRGRRVDDFVYFIRSGDAIKIGTSRNPERRLAVMQTGHPGKLEIVACCQGNAATEKAYHKRFAAHRLSGEWFSPHPDILAEIERLSTHPGTNAGRG